MKYLRIFMHGFISVAGVLSILLSGALIIKSGFSYCGNSDGLCEFVTLILSVAITGAALFSYIAAMVDWSYKNKDKL